MESIWTKKVKIKYENDKDLPNKCDIVVIGAGMAGLLIAYELNKNNKEVIVLEKNKIASGQTQNTTAKITSQHNLIYDTLIQKEGIEKAKQYAMANNNAIHDYETIIKEKNIDCDFERIDSFVYSSFPDTRIKKEYDAAIKLGLSATYNAHPNTPFEIAESVGFLNQAQFNPLKFINGIIQDLCIYEDTFVSDIKKNRIYTSKGTIEANKIIVATHYPIINIPGYYFLKMYQERSYVVAIKDKYDLQGMYISCDENPLSFRNMDKYILVGGGKHRSGENSKGGKYDELFIRASLLFKNCKLITCFSAQDCITNDGIPYIGLYSASTPNMYVATGFNKWGMTSSMVSAVLIRNMILNLDNPNAEVFDPQRIRIDSGYQNLVENSMQAIKGLTRRIIQIPDVELSHLPKGHGGVVNYKNDKLGVYKNNDGETFIVSIKCPHLGCQLEWNPDELSWDCPCHGSRFDYKGKLIDVPALHDIQNEKE